MKKLILSFTSVFGCVLLVFSQAGELDLSFATNGIYASQITDTPDEAKAMAIQPDGKIVTSGYIGRSGPENPTAEDFYLRRFNADGTPDLSFGTAGIVIQDVSGGLDASWDVEIQPDGKIVAAGFGWQSWERAVVMRFNSDGSIDNSFSGDGIAIIEIGG
ncbi:MAG: delta-60 repeat domain-containing protein, partial [Bacteroidota bacterium]